MPIKTVQELLKERAAAALLPDPGPEVVEALIASHLELIEELKKIRNGLVYIGQYVPFSAVCELVDPLIFTKEELEAAQWP